MCPRTCFVARARELSKDRIRYPSVAEARARGRWRIGVEFLQTSQRHMGLHSKRLGATYSIRMTSFLGVQGWSFIFCRLQLVGRVRGRKVTCVVSTPWSIYPPTTAVVLPLLHFAGSLYVYQLRCRQPPYSVCGVVDRPNFAMQRWFFMHAITPCFRDSFVGYRLLDKDLSTAADECGWR